MAKIVTLGEIMLRLKSPAFERLFQSSTLEATFGGGEANVAVSLSVLGMDSSYAHRYLCRYSAYSMIRMYASCYLAYIAGLF